MPTDAGYILAIETSNPGPDAGGGTMAAGVPPRAAVALGRSAGQSIDVIGVEPLSALAGGGGDDLMPAIDRLFGRAGVRPGEIGTIAVSVGPGGFTSLRVAVATVKMIAEATGARCVPVRTALGVIRRVDPALRRDRPAAVLLAWKRRDVWVERFPAGTSWTPTGGGGLVPLEVLAEERGGLIVCDRPLERLLREHGAFSEGAVWAEPRFDPVAVMEASLDVPAVAAADLLPIYPREPEAVSLWAARRR